MSKKYIFREITEKQDLEKIFHMRYEIYSNSKNCGFIKPNEHNIDFDIYDLQARHFGLYANNVLAGYLRIVHNKREFQNEQAFKLGKDLRLFSYINHQEKNPGECQVADYPFLSYQGVPSSIKSYYNNIKKKKEGLVEASRLILSKEHRGLRTSAFLIECALALYIIICIGQKHAVLSCLTEHSNFYKRYGFKPVGNGQPYNPNATNSIILGLTLAIKLSISSIPKQLHPKLEAMANDFKNTRQIIRNF